MTTIPLTAVLLTGEVSAEVLEAAVWNGAHAEVAVGALRELCGPERAAAAVACWDATQALWENLTGDGVLVRRGLLRARQSDGKNGRADLAAELDALSAVPVLARVCDALLEPSIDEDALEGCVVERDGNTTVVRVLVSSPEWPAELGGAGSPGEVRRVFEITANHAKWRDRRLRRLQALSVDVEEVWADPVAIGGKQA